MEGQRVPGERRLAGLMVLVVLAGIGLGAALGWAAYGLDLFRLGPSPIGVDAGSGAGTDAADMAPAPSVAAAPAPRVGAPAPEIGLADLEGRRISLESLRGKVVLINFWASWCPPCEKEMTDLQTLYAEEAERGFLVLGVNEGEEPERAAAFMKSKGITFPTVLDADMTVTRRYQVFGLPNSFFVDAEGIIRARVVGPFTLEQMRGHLAHVRRGTDVEAPRVVSIFAVMAADNERPMAVVNGSSITLGEVNRRLDLETALAALRGGLPPDLTRQEHAAELRRQQWMLAERLVDERLVAARAAAVGITVSEAEIEADLARTAEEVKLPLERLGSVLGANGSDIVVLREAHRAAGLIAHFVAERVLTGNNDEGIDDFEQWLEAARRAAGARVLLPDG